MLQLAQTRSELVLPEVQATSLYWPFRHEVLQSVQVPS
jgi:hypothetical protein